MGIDELALRGVLRQLFEQLLRLGIGHAADRAGVARDIEAHAAAILQAAYQHLRHRLELFALGLVEVGEAQFGARRTIECSATRPAIRRLVASGRASWAARRSANSVWPPIGGIERA